MDNLLDKNLFKKLLAINWLKKLAKNCQFNKSGRESLLGNLHPIICQSSSISKIIVTNLYIAYIISNLEVKIGFCITSWVE